MKHFVILAMLLPAFLLACGGDKCQNDKGNPGSVQGNWRELTTDPDEDELWYYRFSTDTDYGFHRVYLYLAPVTKCYDEYKLYRVSNDTMYTFEDRETFVFVGDTMVFQYGRRLIPLDDNLGCGQCEGGDDD